MPTKKASVRIDYDVLKPAKLAAVAADLTLEEWLTRAVLEQIKREAASRSP